MEGSYRALSSGLETALSLNMSSGHACSSSFDARSITQRAVIFLALVHDYDSETSVRYVYMICFKLMLQSGCGATSTCLYESPPSSFLPCALLRSYQLVIISELGSDCFMSSVGSCSANELDDPFPSGESTQYPYFARSVTGWESWDPSCIADSAHPCTTSTSAC